jgi:glycosyltransferase 2 family protein
MTNSKIPQPHASENPLKEQEAALAALSETDQRRFVRSMRLSRVALPVILGFIAVVWLFYKQFDLDAFRAIAWTGSTFAWIGAAFALLLVRHLFYVLRIWAITGYRFGWRKCLELIVLWEFSAALTPTSKGGPFVMLFVLTKEGIPAGRTMAAVFYTMVCDAGFFVLSLPFLLLLYGPPMLYPGMTSYTDVGLASGTFFVTYGMMATYWVILTFFLFVKPQYAKIALHFLAQRPFMKRWADKLEHLGEDFNLAAAELRARPWREHLHVLVGTVGAWTSKFLMINCLIIAIMPSTPLDGYTQAFVYARLVAMFIIMSFSPTPGGAGLAEVALANFISDYVPKGIGLVVALLWRGMAYYGYLLLGAIVVPNWIRTHLATGEKTVKDASPST